MNLNIKPNLLRLLLLGLSLLLFSVVTLAQNCQIQSDSIVCLNERATFQVNNSGSSISWTFGDGSSSTQATANHIYSSLGVNKVVVNVQYSDGSTCKDSTTIMVHDLPQVNFSMSDSVFCINDQEICIIDSSNGGTTTSILENRYVLWGDGNINFSDDPKSGDSICFAQYPQEGTFTITAEIKNDKGCEAKWHRIITVNPVYEPSFIEDFEAQTCLDIEMCLTNDSTTQDSDITMFIWDFGDGTKDSSGWDSACHTYTEAGTYDVSLDVILKNGCRSSFTKAIPVDLTVYKIGDLVVDTLQCYTETFNVSRVNGSGGFWYEYYNSDTILIDSGYLEGPNPAIGKSLSIGDYFLKIYINDANCVDTSSLFALSSVGVNADFIAQNSDQCTILDTVYFNNKSVWHPKSTLIFQWNFDDYVADSCIGFRNNCNYDTSFYTQHWYTVDSCYTPTLYAIDTTFGCASSDAANLLLGRFIPEFSYELDRPCIGDHPEYEVNFEMTNACGLACKVKAQYDSCFEWESWKKYNGRYTYDTICDSSGWVSVTFAIKRGDTIQYCSCGTSDTIIDLSRVCTDTFVYKNWFKLYESPKFDHNYTEEDCVPADVELNVIVDKERLKRPGQFIYWGDKNPLEMGVYDDSLLSFNNTYDTSGIYHISLEIEDTNRCLWTFDNTLILGYNADFEFDSFVCVGEEVLFNDSIRYEADTLAYWRMNQSAETVSWDFGDTTPIATGPTPTHKFTKTGVYSVKMMTKDKNGCTDTIIKTIYVGGVEAGIKKMDTLYACDQIIQFLDSTTLSAILPNDSITEHIWEFGDGSLPSSLTDPFHYFGSLGQHRIFHVVKTEEGCEDAAYVDIFLEGPVPYFEFMDDSIGCSPLTVDLKSSSENIDGLIWHFGDGDSSTVFSDRDTSLSFTYNEAGVYYIYLEGTLTTFNKATQNFYTCKSAYPDSTQFPPVYKKVVVLETPKVDIDYPEIVCANTEVDIRSISDPVYHYFDWFVDGEIQSDKGDTLTVIFEEEGKHKIHLKPYYSLSTERPVHCLDSMEVEVDVSIVVADFTIEDLGNCTEYRFVDASYNASEYEWDFGHDNSSVNWSNASNPTHDYDPDTGMYEVCLMVQNKNACVDTSCQELEVQNKELLELYNVFTPNLDGLNDEYLVDIIGEDMFQLQIYNRWGEVVFETEDALEGWNGSNINNGMVLPSGTYFYIMKCHFKCTDRSMSSEGMVELIRH